VISKSGGQGETKSRHALKRGRLCEMLLPFSLFQSKGTASYNASVNQYGNGVLSGPKRTHAEITTRHGFLRSPPIYCRFNAPVDVQVAPSSLPRHVDDIRAEVSPMSTKLTVIGPVTEFPGITNVRVLPWR
jgi:hypothetical protein